MSKSPCPYCGVEISQRKNGACPHCGKTIEIYSGRYYREEDGNPAQALLKHFEALVSAQQSQQQGKQIIFHVSKKTTQYKQEMVRAEAMLSAAEGDLELAKFTLNVLFKNKSFAWKTRSSMLQLATDWPLALAIARADLEELAKKEDSKAKSYNQIIGREDIFR